MDTTIIRPKREFPIKFNRKTMLIMIAVAVIVAGAAVMFISSDQNNHKYYDEQISYAEEYMIAKKYDAALECCENAIGVFENEDRAYIMEADIYLDKGDKEKAKKVLEEGQKVADTKELRSKLQSVKNDILYDEYLAKAQVLNKQGKYDEAIKYLNSAIAIKDTDERAYLLIAESYINNNEKSFARDILKKGVGLTGSDKVRAKYIELEGELQAVAHQKDSKEQAEKDALAEKKRAEEEKRQKEQAYERARAEALEKAKAEKNASKNTKWKEAYTATLLRYLNTQKSPEFDNPYIREIDDLLPKKKTESSKSSSSSESTESETTEDTTSGETTQENSNDGSAQASKKQEEKKEFAFELYDIDADGIPELFVSDGKDENAHNEIYTFANDIVMPFDNKSYVGKITSCQDEKLIKIVTTQNGVRHTDFYKKNGINLDTFISFFDNNSADGVSAVNDEGSTEEKGYAINGSKTTEYEYRAQLKKFNVYKWEDLGRKYDLTKKNIEYAVKAYSLNGDLPVEESSKASQGSQASNESSSEEGQEDQNQDTQNTQDTQEAQYVQDEDEYYD